MTSHIGPDDGPPPRTMAQADAELPISDLERELSKEFEADKPPTEFTPGKMAAMLTEYIAKSDGVPESLTRAVSDRTKYPYVAPKPEELQAYIDAAILILPVNPKSPVTYNGVSIAIEDLPTADLRASLGYGHYRPFHRPIIQRTDDKPWPYTPNMCLIATNHKGVWVDPEHLACPGCGLDMT